MFPASLRANKPSKRLPAANNAVHKAYAAQHPHPDDPVGSHGTLSRQAAQDVRWDLPPRNVAASQHHKLATTRPGISSDTRSKHDGPLVPSKHASPQQSRIPSPTKTVPKGGTTHVLESHVNARFRQPTDASQSRHAYQLHTDSRKQPAVQGYPSEVRELVSDIVLKFCRL